MTIFGSDRVDFGLSSCLDVRTISQSNEECIAIDIFLSYRMQRRVCLFKQKKIGSSSIPHARIKPYII